MRANAGILHDPFSDVHSQPLAVRVSLPAPARALKFYGTSLRCQSRLRKSTSEDWCGFCFLTIEPKFIDHIHIIVDNKTASKIANRIAN